MLLANRMKAGSARGASSISRPVILLRRTSCKPSVTVKSSANFGAEASRKGLMGKEWFQTILSRFGPIKTQPPTVSTLEFEKPLLELDKRIREVELPRCFVAPDDT
jgi:hypothetical protein